MEGRMIVYFLLLILTCQEVLGIQISLTPPGKKTIRPLGQGIVITCEVFNVYSSDNFQIQWTDPQKRIIPDINRNSRVYTEQGQGSRSRVKKLYVSNIKSSDAGRYTCVATVDGQKTETFFELSLFKAITFDDAPVFQHPSIYRDANIKCQVSGEPEPVVSWKINDTIPISNEMNHPRYVVSRNSLFIKNVTEADNGYYTCRASVEADGRMAERRISVIVHVPPRIVKGLKDIHAVEGERLVLTCNATGFPRPKFKFIKDGKHLHSHRGYEINEDLASFTIDSVIYEDRGSYECKALNDAGVDQSRGKIVVQVRPKIFELENITKTEREPATLVCRSHGNPAPHMTFRKANATEDFRYGPSELGRIVLTSRNPHQLELHFTHLVHTDIGMYKCSSKNDVGVDEQWTYLNVRYKPRHPVKDQVEHGWAGGKHDIPCVVDANPPPQIQWIRYDRVLENNMTYRITETADTHILTVHIRVDSDDESWIYGNYYCRSKNQVGEGQQTIKFNKASLPERPQPKILQKFSTMVVLGVNTPVYTGGLPVTGYRVVMGKKQMDFNIEDPKTDPYRFYLEGMRLENLQPNTHYDIMVASKNLVGISPMTNYSFTTYDKTKPGQLEIISPSEGDSAYQFKLKWKKPHTGGHPIKKYEIKYRKSSNQNYFSDLAYSYESTTEEVPWIHITSWDYEYDPKVSYVLTGLEPLSIYEVSIHAHNYAGRSPESVLFKFRTSGVTELDRILASRYSLKVGLGILIGFIIIIIILVGIDVACYYFYDCGVTMFVCVKYFKKERASSKESSSQQPQQEQLLEKQQKIPLQVCDQQLQTTQVESSNSNVQTSSSFADEGVQADQPNNNNNSADNYECKPDRRSILSQGDEKWKDVVDELEKELKNKICERKQTERLKSKDLVKRLSALEKHPQNVVNQADSNGSCNVVSESGFVSEKATPESLLNLDASNLMESGLKKLKQEDNLVAIRDEDSKAIEIKLVDINDGVDPRGNIYARTSGGGSANLYSRSSKGADHYERNSAGHYDRGSQYESRPQYDNRPQQHDNRHQYDRGPQSDNKGSQYDRYYDRGSASNSPYAQCGGSNNNHYSRINRGDEALSSYIDNYNQKQVAEDFNFQSFHNKPPPPRVASYQVDYRKAGKHKNYMPPPTEHQLIDVSNYQADERNRTKQT